MTKTDFAGIINIIQRFGGKPGKGTAMSFVRFLNTARRVLVCIFVLPTLLLAACEQTNRPEPKPSAAEALAGYPLIAEDLRLRFLARDPTAYSAFLLGSFPANGYDVQTLGTYLDTAAYCLAANGEEQAEQTEQTFDFITTYLNPSVLLLSVSACDFYTESHWSAFITPDYTTGSLRHGFEDVQRIGDRDVYEKTFGCRFRAVSEKAASADKVFSFVQKWIRVCDEKKIRLIIVLSPVLETERTESLDRAYEKMRDELKENGGSAECWDFSEAPVCADKRFFYNTDEFRVSLGEMVLARIFGNTTVYTPADFGKCLLLDAVQKEKQETVLASGAPEHPTDAENTEKEVPVVLYHHVTEETGYGDSVISVSRLEEHLKALKDAGYTSVHLKQMEEYVMRGTPLPEKPVCITFDDGYESNAVLALPLLEKYQTKATVFFIGWAVGKSVYKDTGKPMFPHFDYETARNMLQTGLVELGSHTYDMHQSDTLEAPGKARIAAEPLDGETAQSFTKALKRDCERFNADFERELGEPVRYFSYPHGSYSPLSEKILADEGYSVTLSTDFDGRNVLVPGLPQSLCDLYRFTVGEETSGEELIQRIESVYGNPKD